MQKLIQIKNFIDNHPLAGKHKLKAYIKFILWQVCQFLFPKEKIIPFIGNTKLAVTKGMTGATGNIYTGLHEFIDMAFLLHYLEKEDLFYDIGANVGSYTILASGYKNVKSVCFEPVPSTYTSLKRNIRINNLDTKVVALNIGVGSKKGVLHFTEDFDTVNHVVFTPENENTHHLVEVNIEDLDTITGIYGIPNLIKIDVEGFETEVLNGMCNVLKSDNLKAIIIELNGSGERYGFDENIIHQKLLSNNFLPYEYFPFRRSLVELKTFGVLNTIYVKDIEFVKNRVLMADKIEVFSESF
jgi:FkbM family methyltransferase